MPPRIPGTLTSSTYNFFSLLSALPTSVAGHPESLTKCTACLFSTTTIAYMKRKGRKRTNQKIDPYRAAQAQQRKTANLEKRKVLQEQRDAALGDPVQSTPTPFLESLNLSANATGGGQGVASSPSGEQYLNYTLTPSTTTQQLAHSKWLTEPLSRSDLGRTGSRGIGPMEAEQHQKRVVEHESQHKNAETAITSIASLSNASSYDKKRINIRRCIETFGRHNTDQILPPKPVSLGPSRAHNAEVSEGLSPEAAREQELLAELANMRRAGPDTGSSEVQIAILTTKINGLLNNLHKKDMHGKRALRLLVHKRQKLLSYLRRKERGGPRWQNLVETLGINDAMWKGEISL